MDYTSACKIGHYYGDQLLSFYRDNPEYVGSNLIGQIVKGMDFNDEDRKGVIAGLFSRLEQALINPPTGGDGANDSSDIEISEFTVSQAGKILECGEKTLMFILRSNRWVTALNEPYQSRIDQGLLKLRIRTSEFNNDGTKCSVRTVITFKGLNKLKELIC